MKCYETPSASLILCMAEDVLTASPLTFTLSEHHDFGGTKDISGYFNTTEA